MNNFNNNEKFKKNNKKVEPVDQGGLVETGSELKILDTFTGTNGTNYALWNHSPNSNTPVDEYALILAAGYDVLTVPVPGTNSTGWDGINITNITSVINSYSIPTNQLLGSPDDRMLIFADKNDNYALVDATVSSTVSTTDSNVDIFTITNDELDVINIPHSIFYLVEEVGTAPTADLSIGSTNYVLTEGESIVFVDSGDLTGDYSNNENNVTQLITAPTGYVIKVIGSYDIQTNLDNLYIYDGDNTTATLLGTVTGGPGNINIQTTGDQIFFSFTSDNSVTSSGWEFTVTAVPNCNGIAGDINQDGVANIQDIVLGVGYIIGSISLDTCGELAADRDLDGNVNVGDIVNIVNIVLA